MKFSILPPTYEKVTWGFYFLDDILINQNKANFEKKFLVISSSINFLILKSGYLIFFLVLFYLKKYT